MRKFNRKRFLILIITLLFLILARHVNNYFHAAENKNFNYKEAEASVKTENQSDYFQVKRVVDGDTIVLDNNERVRYLGINTPETHHPTKGVEYYGKEAEEFNRKLVLAKRIRLEFDKKHFDRYGRTLAYVYLEDGTFVNKELVRLGYARVMTIRPNTKYSYLFEQVQEEARAKKIGLWSRQMKK